MLATRAKAEISILDVRFMAFLIEHRSDKLGRVARTGVAGADDEKHKEHELSQRYALRERYFTEAHAECLRNRHPGVGRLLPVWTRSF
ncbi:protein of unknown function [Paraburkholderia kururiensis]